MFYWAGTSTGAPLSFTKNTTNFAGFVWLAFQDISRERPRAAYALVDVVDLLEGKHGAPDTRYRVRLVPKYP